MKKMALLFLCLAVAGAVYAQNKAWNKPYTEWTAKDVQKLLTESPWAQTDVISDTSSMIFNPKQGGTSHQAQNTSHWVKFLSAKPIRQALCRFAELDKRATPAQIEAARSFIDKKYPDTIVVAVTFESTDPQYNLEANAKFGKATTTTLAIDTYLEVSSGKRVFLKEYQSPGQDGLGAKFIFPRTVDDQPFIGPKDKIIRFVGMGLNVQFKVADMTVNGVLEY